MSEMKWVSVEEALPKNGQAVLVRYAGNNWWSDHTLADGSQQKNWRWQAALFVQGRTTEQIKASGRPWTIGSEDQWGNNRLPYVWRRFGPGELFGQDVTHWAAITDPIED